MKWHRFRAQGFAILAMVLCTPRFANAAEVPPPITPIDPPERGFFAKALRYEGIAIKAPTNVVDEALFAAYGRLAMMLTNLPTVRARLRAAGAELHIIGRDQVTTDLPEWRHDKGKPLAEYNGLTRDQRTRGMGGLLTSCGEENLLKLEQDRYRGRDICVHEFAHNILGHGASSALRQRVRQQYARSLSHGLWVGSYAASNFDEFFAELTMWYFGTHGDLKMTGAKPANGPLGLKAYDPESFALLDEFYRGRMEPPNIVFILIDDMGWRDGGCFGSHFYATPQIDRLAQSGMRFTQAYAACAVCSPTRAAIMTGKSPAQLHLTDWIPGEGTPRQSRFRAPDWQQALPASEVTLPKALKRLGFVTAAIGKWHLGGGESLPEKRGFDVNVAGGATGHPASYFWPYGAPADSHRVPGLAETGGAAGEYLTDRLTDAALSFIETNRSQRFFLYLAHYAVHAPLMARQSLVEETAAQIPADGQSNRVYAAMLRSVDESVGRILKRLEDLGLATNTVVVFTSDNGGAVHFGNPPATSNAPLRLGKGYAYEGGLRVPLLVRVPGLTKPGTVCDEPVISQDFFPTLLELAGAGKSAAATALDGVSWVPLLRGEPRLAERALFWHYPHYWNGTAVTPYSAVRSGDWKLIRFYETGREEVYNLRRDPGEQAEVANQETAKRRILGLRLDAWLREVGAQMPAPRSDDGS